MGRRALRELGGDRAASSRELDRLRAQRDLRVEAREVEQVGRELREPVELAPGQLELAQSSRSTSPSREILARAARASPRATSAASAARATRSRRTHAARAPGGRSARLHRRERAREVADLVAALVGAGARRGPRRAIRSAAAPQALRRRGEPPDEREPEQQRDAEPDDRGAGRTRGGPPRRSRRRRRTGCGPRATQSSRLVVAVERRAAWRPGCRRRATCCVTVSFVARTRKMSRGLSGAGAGVVGVAGSIVGVASVRITRDARAPVQRERRARGPRR